MHGDIKPGNFAISAEQADRTIFMIDFGLSSRYYDNVYDAHIPYSEGHALTGTPLFASLNQHKGIAYSRRDDVISLTYMLLYLLRGSLPWQHIGHPNSPMAINNDLMTAAKAKAKVYQLCGGFPSPLAHLFNYVMLLHFDEEPNYKYIRLLLRHCLLGMAKSRGDSYDWEK